MLLSVRPQNYSTWDKLLKAFFFSSSGFVCVCARVCMCVLRFKADDWSLQLESRECWRRLFCSKNVLALCSGRAVHAPLHAQHALISRACLLQGIFGLRLSFFLLHLDTGVLLRPLTPLHATTGRESAAFLMCELLTLACAHILDAAVLGLASLQLFFFSPALWLTTAEFKTRKWEEKKWEKNVKFEEEMTHLRHVNNLFLLLLFFFFLIL